MRLCAVARVSSAPIGYNKYTILAPPFMKDSFADKPEAELGGFATKAVRGGQSRTGEGEHSDPIFLTSSYVFENAAQAAARFSGAEEGNVYSRYTNPTVRAFEKRITLLEGATDAVATASGMAAILSTCMALLQSGDHILCSRDVFGATTVLFDRYLRRFGLEIDFVPLTDTAAWESALRPETRLLFLETPSNPLCEVADIAALAKLCRGRDCLLAVDNCFCTPALQRPLELGADLVIHSATKYLDGQGRCLGGVVLGAAEQVAEVRSFLRAAGPAMSPFNAWVFYTGLETLALRMQAHCRGAQFLAEWLQERTEQVFYPGLPEHPGHETAKRQQTGFGGVLSFRLGGGQEVAWHFIDALRMISLTANLGDTKTTVVHPATTTHGRLSEEERAAAGITPDLVRIAVGLEEPADIKEDLKRGFAALARS